MADLRMTDEQTKILLGIKADLAELATNTRHMTERLERVEQSLGTHYATKESLGRLDDRVQEVRADLTARASNESIKSLTERVAKAEDTLTWAVRGLIGAFGAIAVAALTFFLKTGK